MTQSLFEPVVSEDKLARSFVTVARSVGYGPARATLDAVFETMGPRDPHFVREFQTTGFDARIFELYLFAALQASNFAIEMIGHAPDFVVQGFGERWAIEATTANPSGGGPAPKLPSDPDELQRYIDGELVVRLGSALFSKLNKKYWELPHLKDVPLVLALENFASEGSHFFADTALCKYLYGLRTSGELDDEGELRIQNHEIEQHVGSKTIPSRFFGLPHAEHISAVLWSNSGTIAKFARMGFQQGLDSEGIAMRRTGARYVMDPNATEPAMFSYAVGGEHWESWHEGLVMAHNPSSRLPLHEGSFPGIVHHQLRPDGLLEATLPRFHAFWSRTHIVTTRADPNHTAER